MQGRLVFNDETNKEQSILHQISKLTGLDAGVTDADLFTSYPLWERTQDMNEAHGAITTRILMVNNRFKYDDPNHADATGQATFQFGLTEDVDRYTLIKAAPDASSDFLTFDRVEVEDESGKVSVLTPIDISDTDEAWAEFEDTAGTPLYYDFDGVSIFFKPAPDYTKANAVTIYPTRSPIYFATSDTSKAPGVMTPILPAYAYYCAVKKLSSINNGGDFNALIGQYQNKLIEFIGDPVRRIDGYLQKLYAHRNRSENLKISRNKIRKV